MLEKFPTRRQFKAWLKDKPVDEIVSQNWTCQTCPLARFLDEITHRPGWAISPSLGDSPGIWRRALQFMPDNNVLEIEALKQLPRWADRFARAIDRDATDADNFTGFRPVTPIDCLRTLAKL